MSEQRDNRAAPPNVSQIEAAGGDVEEATENQQGGLSEEEVTELNEQIAKDQAEAAEFWEKERKKNVAESEGLALPDPLKPDKTKAKDEPKKAEPKTEKPADK